MPLYDLLDIDLAVFLAECCVEAYTQFKNGGNFRLPKPYKLVKPLYGTAANVKQLFGYIIESPGAIVIAFRGTQSDPDWAADLAAYQTDYPYYPQPLRTHAGFTSVYSTCREQIMEVLKKHTKPKTLLITGHSLGGALAALCALDIKTNTPFNPLMYNFGAPRVGESEFAVVYNEALPNSIRIMNVFDIVTLLPPAAFSSPFTKKVWYYEHVGNTYAISTQTGSVYGNHSITTYLKTVLGIQKAKGIGNEPASKRYTE